VYSRRRARIQTTLRGPQAWLPHVFENCPTAGSALLKGRLAFLRGPCDAPAEMMVQQDQSLADRTGGVQPGRAPSRGRWITHLAVCESSACRTNPRLIVFVKDIRPPGSRAKRLALTLVGSTGLFPCSRRARAKPADSLLRASCGSGHLEGGHFQARDSVEVTDVGRPDSPSG
jgi:hypothetical protein